MDIQKIKELALANGFSLKEQASGNMDLHSYVYEFANAIEQAAKDESHKQAALYQSEINHLAHANQQWREKAAKAQAIPDGFVLVPKEPTQKMLNAGHVVMNPIKGSLVQAGTNQKRRDCYKAMIEAAQEQGHD